MLTGKLPAESWICVIQTNALYFLSAKFKLHHKTNKMTNACFLEQVTRFKYLISNVL